MEQMPNNLLIKHGRAKALDHLAEKKRSNDLLQDAITSYIDILKSSDISNDLFVQVADRCIDRIRFRGHYNRAVEVHKQIIERFPNSAKFRNQLAVTLLTSNRLAEAKRVLNEVLALWPEDGFAQVHYGFILKIKDNNLTEAVKYLKNGIQSREPGVINGRFYFHLGDALTRLGKSQDALKVYEDGVKQNVFLSKYQRSLYNVDRLTARPWWNPTDTPYNWFFKLLERKWRTIRDEGLNLISKEGFFKDEAENLRDTGEWKQFELFARGVKMTENCKKCPETCKLVENLADAKGCRRGQVKFSVMHPGTHVWPHCGPSNCRLRAHLGLKVPSGTFIRVAEETRSWKESKVFIFDDSFEHEVWHNGSDFRLVLIVDVWHPELTAHEKRALPAI